MSCSSCHLDLSGTTFIHCAECIVPSVALCLLCFNGGYTTTRYHMGHDYYVLHGHMLGDARSVTDSIYVQLSLLDSIRKGSVGAWVDAGKQASQLMVTTIEETVLRLYTTWAEVGHVDACVETDGLCRSSDIVGNVLQRPPLTTIVPNADLPGFMPRREDFEIEYDDTAELAIADLEFYGDETINERESKCGLLLALNQRLHRRETVKKFAIDNGLVSVREQLEALRSNTAEEVDLRGKLRSVRRFFESSHEFNEFLHLTLCETRLRARLDRIDDHGIPEIPTTLSHSSVFKY
jgi:transcriptional adapter 2-alpha